MPGMKMRLIFVLFFLVILCAGGCVMSRAKRLDEYKKRRETTRSGEPSARIVTRTEKPIFVIQKHAARHVHYDVRLLIDGVLVSWAVPKGPSTDPAIKRLAIRTDDHPLDYANFEGTIPEGEYGAGTVMMWDKGTYKNIKTHDGKMVPMEECLKNGTIEVWLEGTKLQGGYAFVRMQGKKEQWLMIKMKDVDLTHPDRIIFPQANITKRELLEYYERVAPVMLPHMKDRLLTMQRFVNGVEEEGFYQKNAAEYFPKWIHTKKVAKQEDGDVHYVVCDNIATLMYLVNQVTVTFHLWLSRADKLRFPDRMIFDLDPSVPGFAAVRKAAKQLKLVVEDELGLTTFIMTTGSRGVHIMVPLDRTASFTTVHKFAHDVANLMVARFPQTLTTEMHKAARGTRIFVDYLRNAFAQTGVAPYSVRAQPNASVATPIDWDELDHVQADTFTIKTIEQRLHTRKCPWMHVDNYACSLKEARKKLTKLLRAEQKNKK
jgi:bifunctional non-homologous end joining protein LigD